MVVFVDAQICFNLRWSPKYNITKYIIKRFY